MSESKQTAKTRRSFRLRYRLSTLFLLMTALGIGLGYVVYQAKRQKKMLAELQQMASEVAYFDNRAKPEWLPEVLDTGVLDRVRGISIRHTPVADTGIFAEFKNLQWLIALGQE